MIHTFTVRIRVRKDFYESFLSHSQTKMYKESYQDYQTAKNALLEEIGIVLYGHKYKVVLKRDINGFVLKTDIMYVIDARVNPSKVIYRENAIDIYKPSDYETFRERFNKEIKSFNLSFLPELKDWQSYRVDFTYQIRTPYVKEYIRLFHKTDIRGFGLKRDKHGHASMKPGSLYICNSSVTLNFYDKQDEMRKAQGGTRHTPEEISQAKDILRIEVQAGRDKLSGIKRKNEFTSKKITEFMTSEKAVEDVVTGYASRVLGDATYRKKTAAITLIKRSGKRKATQEKLIAVLDEVGKPYSRVDKVREAHPELEIDKCRSVLKKMDINIVTLNKNSKVAELPSVPALLREAILEEKRVPR